VLVPAALDERTRTAVPPRLPRKDAKNAKREIAVAIASVRARLLSLIGSCYALFK